MKASALPLMITAVFQGIDGRFWLAIPLGVVALASVIAGSTISPGRETGAFTARDMMEINNVSQMVKPPNGNVMDPGENERFRGR